MEDAIYLILKIFGYTAVIIGLILVSKKTLIPYIEEKNIKIYRDKKVQIKEKIQIDKGMYLILVEYDDKEMLIAISPNAVNTITMSEVGEENIE